MNVHLTQPALLNLTSRRNVSSPQGACARRPFKDVGSLVRAALLPVPSRRTGPTTGKHVTDNRVYVNTEPLYRPILSRSCVWPALNNILQGCIRLLKRIHFRYI